MVELQMTTNFFSDNNIGVPCPIKPLWKCPQSSDHRHLQDNSKSNQGDTQDESSQ